MKMEKKRKLTMIISAIRKQNRLLILTQNTKWLFRMQNAYYHYRSS